MPTGSFTYWTPNNGELHQDKHQPLITKGQFDQLQLVVKNRGFVRSKISYNYPFAGFMRCSQCCFIITAETKTKFYKGTNRTARYTYYRCTRKNKHINCRQPFIRQEELVSQLDELIKKHSLPEGWGNEFYQRIDEEEKQFTQSLIESGQAVKLHIANIKSQLNTLLTNYLDQTIDRDDYLDRKNELMKQRKTLEENLTSLPKFQTAWLGPFRDWVKLGLEAKKTADPTTDYYEKRQFMLNTGSDFRLKDKKAYFFSGKHPAAPRQFAT